MNRIIKFRAWLRDEYMSYSHTNKGLAYLEFDDDGSTIIGEDDGDQRYENVPVMQFTGLYDKNKKPIYEGDILRQDNIKFINGDKNGHTYVVVEWREPIWNRGGGFNIGMGVGIKWEVIGNIFENSDLIKGGNK